MANCFLSMAQPAEAVAPGSLVLGRYRPIRPLGSGGSGSVWLAREELTGRDVALKIVPREGNAGSRAEREAATAARLRHARCLRAHALARDGGHVYIVYEYVAGRTFREAIRAGEVNDAIALETAGQILEGLAHAHAHGVVHRDVKPANVLLEEGSGVSVKIFDFGLALMQEEETLTAVGDIPGTLAYMSPERLRGETAGPPSDVWAVGVLLWEALAGQHPFWGGTLLDTAHMIQSGAPSLRESRPDLPRPVVACVDRALAVDPERRPTAAELATRLRRASTSRRPSTPVRRRRVRIRWSVAAGRTLPPAAAGAFTAFVAATMPFFPSGWALGLGLMAAAISAASARAGLAFALAVPILPLGNYSLGLAIAYTILATAWLALSWREPRSGLFLALGPIVAPIAALGFLPVAGQLVRNPARRAAQVAAGVLAAAAVARVAHLSQLEVDSSEKPLVAALAAGTALVAHREVIVEAIALAAAAVLLPLVRGRGGLAAAGFGAAVTALAMLPAPGLAALPIVLAAWVTAVALAAEPYLKARRRGPVVEAQTDSGLPEEPTAEAAHVVSAPPMAREAVGGG